MSAHDAHVASKALDAEQTKHANDFMNRDDGTKDFTIITGDGHEVWVHKVVLVLKV